MARLLSRYGCGLVTVFETSSQEGASFIPFLHSAGTKPLVSYNHLRRQEWAYFSAPFLRIKNTHTRIKHFSSENQKLRQALVFKKQRSTAVCFPSISVSPLRSHSRAARILRV